MGSFSMIVGYFLTISHKSVVIVSCLRCTPSPLTAALHVVDLILWSFALQTVGTYFGLFHQNVFVWKPTTTSSSSRSKQRHQQNNTIKAFNSESLF